MTALSHPSVGDDAIIVLYDGACRLCRRSVSMLLRLDSFHRLRPIDFRDPTMRERYAPDLALKDLDRSMHIRISKEWKTESGKRKVDVLSTVHCPLSTRTLHGFDAFRALCWHLPVLWPLAPLLYIPGVPPLGRRIYAHIAKNRNRCADGYCVHENYADR